MSYVNRNLMPGETIIATAKLHWIIFLRSAVILLLSIGLLSYSLLYAEPIPVWALRIPALGFLILALGTGAKALIRHVTSEYAVTNKRVLVKVGLIRRDSLELLLAKVEAIGVNQSIIGRLLGYGVDSSITFSPLNPVFDRLKRDRSTTNVLRVSWFCSAANFARSCSISPTAHWSKRSCVLKDAASRVPSVAASGPTAIATTTPKAIATDCET